MQVNVEPFEDKEFDVTPCCTKICYCGKRVMTLHNNELLITDTTMCGTETNHVSYGELTVGKSRCCGCTSVNGENIEETAPGWGQEDKLVDEIYSELHKRIERRGDIAQLHRTTEALALSRTSLAELAALHEKVDSLLAARGVSAAAVSRTSARHSAPGQQQMRGSKRAQPRPRRQPFPRTEYDTTNMYEALCGCTCTKLVLDQEEAYFTRECGLCCSKSVNRMPYAEIGTVNKRQENCNFFVSSKLFGEISPGLGCSEDVVMGIYNELGRRAHAHGDAGQTKMGLYAMDYMHGLTEALADMSGKMRALRS